MNVKKLRILLADDHALVRRGAREVLETRQAWRVVGQAATGIEAVEKAKKFKPDVAILDISMPDLDGVQATRQIREAVPTTKVLVLTMHESDEMVQSALEAGAHGYVLKSDLTTSLVKAVKGVSGGELSLTPKVSKIVLEGFRKGTGQNRQQGKPKNQPTSRELEIMRLLAEGKTNKEIAWQLEIGVRTVEAHRANVMRKLGLRSLAELIRYALSHGMVSPSSDAGPSGSCRPEGD